MAPRVDAYTIQMKNLHQRYGLSKTIVQLFIVLDNHRSGANDPKALGRWLRMNSGLRQACTDTISSLADAMRKSPTLGCVAECTSLIKSCTDMLRLADEPKEDFFPFMQLPAELRQRVYKFYIRGLFSSDLPGPAVIISSDMMRCPCPPHERQRNGTARSIMMRLCETTKQIKNEVLTVWFDSQVFHFACCCELRHHLQKNVSLHNHLRNLMVHWTGETADDAFEMLKQVSTLKRLTILISRSTTNRMSKREIMMCRYFNSKSATRLCDALGFEELISLRGLKEIEVEHVHKTQALRRTNEDRQGLENILRQHVIQDEDE